MRTARYASYVLAAAICLLFQGIHISRTVERARLGAYSRALLDFLGMRNERERYLLIRHGGARRGYSGLRVERLFDRSDARYRVALEAFASVLPWLGRRGDVRLEAELLLDDRGISLYREHELGRLECKSV